MKGLILAGGTGSRLWPNTKAVNKHLLPVYDKPLIHYPLATLMLAGIQEIAIVTSPEFVGVYANLFKDCESLNISLEIIEQEKPAGLPQGVILAEKFLGEDSFAMVLGDNIFHGVGLGQSLVDRNFASGARIHCFPVANPHAFGVIEIVDGNIVSMEEKPEMPKSNLAITGLYFFDSNAIEYASTLSPSKRGELEITDLLNCYLKNNSLSYEILQRGTAWLDTGTSDSLLDASNYVRIIEQRQGNKIACLEEIAWRNNWISDGDLMEISAKVPSTEYSKYLVDLVNHQN